MVKCYHLLVLFKLKVRVISSSLVLSKPVKRESDQSVLTPLMVNCKRFKKVLLLNTKFAESQSLISYFYM